MRRLLVLVSSLLVASGCLGSQLAAPHLTTTGKTSSTATASSFCQRPMTLRGDVTGDGRPDRVTLSEKHVAADQACIPRLTIHVAGGAVITSGLSNVGHEPFSAILLGLGPVDRRPGDEMLITLVCGTACFPGIFTVTDGSIVQETTGREVLVYGGGTASTANTVWCDGKGRIAERVDGSSLPRGKKKWIRTVGTVQYMHAVGTTFVTGRSIRRERTMTLTQWQHQSLPVPIGRPFAGCMTVRGQNPTG